MRAPSSQSRRNGFAIVVAMFAVMFVIRVVLSAVSLPARVELLISDTLTYEITMVCVVGMGLVLILGRHLTGVERRFWSLLVGATACVLASEVYWTWYSVTVDMRGPEADDPVRLLGLVAAALFGALIVTMTEFGKQRAATRLRIYLDLLAGLLTLYPFVYWFVTAPAIADLPRGGTIGAAAAAIYPLVGAAILFVCGAVIVGWKTYPWRLWERFTLASLILYAIGLLAYPAWYPQALVSQSQGPSWFTFVLAMGQLLLLAAIVDRFASDPEDMLAEPWPTPRFGPQWVWQAYPVAVAMCLPFSGWLAIRVATHPHGLPVLYATVLVTLALGARSWVAAIERAHHRMEAFTDPVTGARTLEGFGQRIEDLVAHASERGRELAVIVIDVMDLGVINDRYGHAAGDRALARVTEVLSREAPRGAEVVRLADDEIAVVVPDLAAGEAVEMARRIYGRYRIHGYDEEGPSEITIGISVYPEHALAPTDLLNAAFTAERAARVAVNEPIAVYDAQAMRDFDPDEHLTQARMRSLRATVRALAEAVDARDPATRNHSANVAELAASLAQVLGIADEQVQLIALAALMHDVGKIGVRDEVLLKPGPLDDEERAQVEMHAQLGARILEPAGLVDLLPLVRHHHERWDGHGYPEGLYETAIPLGARILAVCDAFETITTGRPYRAAGSTSEALTEISQGAGTQFDPDVARAFCRMVVRLAEPGQAAAAGTRLW